MKNAILISGKAGSGKTRIAHAIAAAISPDKSTWVSCNRTAKSMRLKPNTRVVIVDELTDFDNFLEFLQLMSQGNTPFFIFQSQIFEALPTGKIWIAKFAHLNLDVLQHAYEMKMRFQHSNGEVEIKIEKRSVPVSYNSFLITQNN